MRPKRQSQSVEPGFDDPLKNYDAPEYADDLESALAEESMAAIKCQPFSSVKPTETVENVMRTMARQGIASVLVIDGDEHVLGIFSERDVLNKVSERFEEVKDSPVSDVMTANPTCVYESDSPGKAMNLMATAGFRHVPILDVDDKVVGVIGPRRVTKFLNSYLA